MKEQLIEAGILRRDLDGAVVQEVKGEDKRRAIDEQTLDKIKAENIKAERNPSPITLDSITGILPEGYARGFINAKEPLDVPTLTKWIDKAVKANLDDYKSKQPKERENGK